MKHPFLTVQFPAAVIVLILLLTALSAMLPAAYAEEESKPVIYLLQAPAYKEKSDVVGMVRMSDTSPCNNVSDYRIVLFIQVVNGEACWIKPGDTDSSGNFKTVPIAEEDGSFSARYYSYGEERDLTARYIYVFLVPKDFTPTMNGIQAAENECIDQVTIIREANGQVSISPSRELEKEHSKDANLPVRASKIAVNIDFYTSGRPNQAISESTMRAHLNAVSKFADTVRFYSASGTANKAYAIAKGMGFRVIGNAWISGNATDDKREMDALIKLANDGLVDMAVVGSETQYAGLCSMDTLIRDIMYVRDRITADIPVTTAETLGIVAGSARLRKACDVLFVNSYPIYEKIPIENAVSHLTNQLQNLHALGNGKQLIVSETGWATAGSPVANGDNAVQYFEGVRAWSLRTGINVVYFQSADAPWKESQEKEYGAHWGFMDTKLRLKGAYAQTRFFYNAGLGTIIATVPSGTTTIEANAFKDCKNMKYLYLPSTVTDIDSLAFDGCSSLVIVADEGSYAWNWANLDENKNKFGLLPW